MTLLVASYGRTGSDTADLLLDRSRKAIASQDYDAAEQILDAAIAFAPEEAAAWNTRATLRYIDDDYDRSMADIAQTLKREPRHLGALMGMANILTARDRKKEALDVYERVLSIAPHGRPPRPPATSSRANSRGRRCEPRGARGDRSPGVTVALVVLIVIGLLGGFTAFEERRIEARYPPDGKRVAIEGGAIHVMDKPADGDGRPAVLLIHGASGNAADPFAALADPLAAKGMRALSSTAPAMAGATGSAGRLLPLPRFRRPPFGAPPRRSESRAPSSPPIRSAR